MTADPPPVSLLLAFEAVVRLGGVTRAAGALGLTQSAVSHQLRRLEGYFGCRLLSRERPGAGVALTADGHALFPEVVRALEALAVLEDARRRRLARTLAGAGSPHGGRLRVGVGAALANWWLVPRLGRFTAAHPGTELDLVTVENSDTLDEHGLDLVIKWVPAAESWATASRRPLAREQVFPVCRPELLGVGASVDDPELLRSLPLLHKGTAQRGEWSWSQWFEQLGVPYPAGDRHLHFSDAGLALRAALDGMGVALTRSLLVYDALRDGQLVRLLPRVLVPSTKLHVTCSRPGAGPEPGRETFRAWLQREAESCLADAALAGGGGPA